MKYRKPTKSSLFLRWSYSVPLLSYLAFFLLIWTLSLPLSPFTRRSTIILNSQWNKPEDSFEIRMKNSNFNSDKVISDNEVTEESKNEYLVNTNNKENVNKNQNEILQDVFSRADKNMDRKLDSNELSLWIRKKIMEHISLAVSNNFNLFSQIDVDPKNGVVTWKEYHSYFLKKRGFSSKYVKKHDEKRHKGLLRSVKEQILRDKAYWMEAARSNPDALTVDEFLAFTHPESSAANQLALVDELYDKFDRNGDDFLTEEEFAVLQAEGNDETMVIRQDEHERRAEFRKAIDLNGDGKADRRELLHYVAPQSPRHSEHEAEALLALADVDKDNMLSLNEMLAHPDLFLKSKMVDTARSFHDEF
ncbi:45 kDa calcium-binding protein [Coccinella septempunctata]|uniref:45 kDa calcium-binding protein n=1 Tax=Coccinella septempunctata TaxID=41139 RepID=UPI001D096239|nr:45 kDa calcium-binding protein [Coccinella septempunctata]